MDIEIYESKVEFKKPTCVTFDSHKAVQEVLSEHAREYSGICIFLLNANLVNIYKFAYNCLSDDGQIEPVTENFELKQKDIKQLISLHYFNKVIRGE